MNGMPTFAHGEIDARKFKALFTGEKTVLDTGLLTRMKVVPGRMYELRFIGRDAVYDYMWFEITSTRRPRRTALCPYESWETFERNWEIVK